MPPAAFALSTRKGSALSRRSTISSALLRLLKALETARIAPPAISDAVNAVVFGAVPDDVPLGSRPDVLDHRGLESYEAIAFRSTDGRVDQSEMAFPAQPVGQVLPLGVAERDVGIECRMIRLVRNIRKVADEIGQKLHISRRIMEMAYVAEFARLVERDLGRRHHRIPAAIPGAPRLVVETIASLAGVGEGRVHMGVAINTQIVLPALPGQFAPIHIWRAPLLRHKTRAGQPLDLRQDFHLLVAVHQAAKSRRLVVCGRDQSDQRAIVQWRDLQAPPRSASR